MFDTLSFYEELNQELYGENFLDVFEELRYFSGGFNICMRGCCSASLILGLFVFD